MYLLVYVCMGVILGTGIGDFLWLSGSVKAAMPLYEGV